MIEVGQFYELEAVKKVGFGVYLDAENLGDVLLPNRFVPEGLQVGQSVSVFLYLDSEDRLIATTQKPFVEVGQFAFLKVVETTPIGAFLEWGLDKNLLVPFSEQHKKLEEGKSYIAYVYINAADQRIVASTKVDKYIDDVWPHRYEAKDNVDLIIANTTDLGYKAVINNTHWGVLYKNEVFQTLSFGQSIKGQIKQIRQDGKIDLSLIAGRQCHDQNCEKILAYLGKHGGHMPFHDKSTPAEISQAFGISKAAFKKALGTLYKHGQVELGGSQVSLVEK